MKLSKSLYDEQDALSAEALQGIRDIIDGRELQLHDVVEFPQSSDHGFDAVDILQVNTKFAFVHNSDEGESDDVPLESLSLSTLLLLLELLENGQFNVI